MTVFINADDFGLSQSKTQAIDWGIQAGWIQRTSLIVNGEAVEQAVTLCRAHGYADRVCFHLNLVEGKPLTDEITETALCSGGVFCEIKNRTLLCRGMSPRTIRAIRRECEAQMRRFRELGFTSAHIDSHKWCLCSLPAWLAIRPLLEEYGFKTTRTLNGHRLSSCGGAMRRYYRMLVRMISGSLRTEEDWSGCGSELERALSAGKLNEQMRAELYVHPDMNGERAVDALYSYRREQKPLEEVFDLVCRQMTAAH